MAHSTFYSSVLLPSRPPGTSIDVKRTRYRKISNFLKEMEERGLVTLEVHAGFGGANGFSRRGLDEHHELARRSIGIIPVFLCLSLVCLPAALSLYLRFSPRPPSCLFFAVSPSLSLLLLSLPSPTPLSYLFAAYCVLGVEALCTIVTNPSRHWPG